MHDDTTTNPPPTPPTVGAPREWGDLRPMRFYARLASEPVLADGVTGLCDALPAAMPRRTVELVALRVSATVGCAYAWAGHACIALASGLSEAEIAAVAAGPSALADPDDAAVVRGVDELLADGRLAPATHAQLGPRELAVTVATAAYQLVAGLMDGVAPEPDVPAVAGLETPARARATHAALALAGAATTSEGH